MGKANVMNIQTLVIVDMDLIKTKVGISLNVEVVEIRCHMVCGSCVEIPKEITRILRAAT